MFPRIYNLETDKSLTDHRDCWQWSLGGSAGFTVASIRSLVDSHSLDIGNEATHWNRSLLIKVNVFLWRLKINKLPSRVNLDRRGIEICGPFSPNGGSWTSRFVVISRSGMIGLAACMFLPRGSGDGFGSWVEKFDIFGDGVEVGDKWSSYARAMNDLRANEELKDSIVMTIPNPVGEGVNMCTVSVEYEWKPPRCSSCKVFRHVHNECPKKIVSDVMKNLNNPRQANKGVLVGLEQVEVSRQEVSNSNPFDALNSIENDADLGTNEGNSKSAVEWFLKCGACEVEVVFDETANLMALTSFKGGSDRGCGTNSLLCDELDIMVRGSYCDALVMYCDGPVVYRPCDELVAKSVMHWHKPNGGCQCNWSVLMALRLIKIPKREERFAAMAGSPFSLAVDSFAEYRLCYFIPVNLARWPYGRSHGGHRIPLPMLLVDILEVEIKAHSQKIMYFVDIEDHGKMLIFKKIGSIPSGSSTPNQTTSSKGVDVLSIVNTQAVPSRVFWDLLRLFVHSYYIRCDFRFKPAQKNTTAYTQAEFAVAVGSYLKKVCRVTQQIQKGDVHCSIGESKTATLGTMTSHEDLSPTICICDEEQAEPNHNGRRCGKHLPHRLNKPDKETTQ
ncbi:hypothetical protein Tco_0359909 [Tanacetum coccineum]